MLLYGGVVCAPRRYHFDGRGISFRRHEARATFIKVCLVLPVFDNIALTEDTGLSCLVCYTDFILSQIPECNVTQ